MPRPEYQLQGSHERTAIEHARRFAVGALCAAGGIALGGALGVAAGAAVTWGVAAAGVAGATAMKVGAVAFFCSTAAGAVKGFSISNSISSRLEAPRRDGDGNITGSPVSERGKEIGKIVGIGLGAVTAIGAAALTVTTPGGIPLALGAAVGSFVATQKLTEWVGSEVGLKIFPNEYGKPVEPYKSKDVISKEREAVEPAKSESRTAEQQKETMKDLYDQARPLMDKATQGVDQGGVDNVNINKPSDKGVSQVMSAFARRNARRSQVKGGGAVATKSWKDRVLPEKSAEKGAGKNGKDTSTGGVSRGGK